MAGAGLERAWKSLPSRNSCGDSALFQLYPAPFPLPGHCALPRSRSLLPVCSRSRFPGRVPRTLFSRRPPRAARARRWRVRSARGRAVGARPLPGAEPVPAPRSAAMAAAHPGPAAPAAPAPPPPPPAAAAAAAPGILIGDRLYSEVSLTIDHSLIPEERLSPTPSMQDGLDLQCETDLRILGCELIQAAGILLRLPQVAMATGQVLFHRFFYSKSFVKHSFEIVAMACINLASKIEEAPRRIRDVINVFHHLRQLRAKSDQLHLPKPG
uniref:Cyclin L1 n=1 Tax=Taeniopygia guttata TaxID=59729 RepID=A0A674HLF6_TAEGU